jgi:hypothetical protein
LRLNAQNRFREHLSNAMVVLPGRKVTFVDPAVDARDVSSNEQNTLSDCHPFLPARFLSISAAASFSRGCSVSSSGLRLYTGVVSPSRIVLPHAAFSQCTITGMSASAGGLRTNDSWPQPGQRTRRGFRAFSSIGCGRYAIYAALVNCTALRAPSA